MLFELTFISQDLLGRRNVHELLLSLLLVLFLLELVRVPLHRQLLVGLQCNPVCLVYQLICSKFLTFEISFLVAVRFTPSIL